MNNLKEKLLKEIQSGGVTMTPRMYFTLQWGALVVASAAVLGITVVIFNFMFFSIRMSGNDALLGFGPQGIGFFLRFFPWPFLVFDIALIVFLQWLLRHFRFGYKIPVLYLISVLIFGALVAGFAFDRATPLNDRLNEGRARLPQPVRGFYEGAGKPPPMGSGVCRCTILAIEGNKLIVEDTRNATSTLTVFLPENARRATTTGLAVGDVVFIAGDESGGVIHAFGVRRAEGFGQPMGSKPLRGQ